MNTLVPIGAALVAWTFAVVLDSAHFALHLRAAQASTSAAWYWGGLPLTILFAAILIASGWAIGFRRESPRWVGLPIAFLAFVLMVGLPFVTTGLAPFEALLRRPLIRSALLLREAAPTSLFMIQTSAILLSGLIALFHRREPAIPPNGSRT